MLTTNSCCVIYRRLSTFSMLVWIKVSHRGKNQSTFLLYQGHLSCGSFIIDECDFAFISSTLHEYFVFVCLVFCCHMLVFFYFCLGGFQILGLILVQFRFLPGSWLGSGRDYRTGCAMAINTLGGLFHLPLGGYFLFLVCFYCLFFFSFMFCLFILIYWFFFSIWLLFYLPRTTKF